MKVKVPFGFDSVDADDEGEILNENGEIVMDY